MAFWVVMFDKHGQHHKMKALGMNAITSNIQPVDINGMVCLLKDP